MKIKIFLCCCLVAVGALAGPPYMIPTGTNTTTDWWTSKAGTNRLFNWECWLTENTNWTWIQTFITNQGASNITSGTIATARLGSGTANASSFLRGDQTWSAPAALPAGIICMWSGTLANVPTGWALCDGSNGTPDLRDRFIMGWSAGVNPGGTGGANTATNQFTPAGTVSYPASVPTFSGTPFTEVINHTHTATVTDPGHSHTQSVNSATTGSSNGYGVDTSTGTWSASGFKTSTNTTGITVSTANPAGGVTSITPAGTVAWPASAPTFNGTAGQIVTTNVPAYYKLAFIIKT